MRRAQAFRVLALAFDAVWLGLLDRAALAHVDETYYRHASEELDGQAFSYADAAWNARSLSDWEAAVVDARFPPGGRVVVTGAGGGREVLALLERGFDAVGFEPNAGLVEAGSRFLAERGHPGRLLRSERDVFPETAGPCDAVLVGWGSYMLIPGRPRRIAFLRGARAAVPEGAPVLVSFFTRSETDRLAAPAARAANVVRALRGEERVEPGDALVPNFAHHFVRAEIEEEMARAGFRLERYETAPYGHALGVAVGVPSR